MSSRGVTVNNCKHLTNHNTAMQAVAEKAASVLPKLLPLVPLALVLVMGVGYYFVLRKKDPKQLDRPLRKRTHRV